MQGQQLNGHTESYPWSNKRKILFIRHGENEAHVGKAAAYIEGDRLTSLGRIKAQEIAACLPETPDLIVTSPYLRAWETSLPTRKRFPTAPCQTWSKVQEFTYLGSIAGLYLTKQERKSLVRKYWERSDPTYKDAGISESFADLICRASEVLQFLRRIDGFVVVFTHEQFIRAVQSILEGWMGDSYEHMPMKRFRDMLLAEPLAHGCMLEMFEYPESWERPGTLVETFYQETAFF